MSIDGSSCLVDSSRLVMSSDGSSCLVMVIHVY